MVRALQLPRREAGQASPPALVWWPDLVWWMRGLQLVKDSEPGPKCMGVQFQGTCVWQPRRLSHWIPEELHRGKWHVNYFVLKHNDWFMLVKQINNNESNDYFFFSCCQWCFSDSPIFLLGNSILILYLR